MYVVYLGWETRSYFTIILTNLIKLLWADSAFYLNNTTTVNNDERNTQNMTNLLHSLTDTLLQDYIRRLVPSYDSVL